MKLAACYTVWNGLELLSGSIEQIYNHVDLIFIGWQFVSNRGEQSVEVEDFLSRYADDPKIRLVEFVPNLKTTTKKNELDKHNLLLSNAREALCTHFLILATDHYYEPKEFITAKEMIQERGFSVTFSQMFTYYKGPTWRLDPIESYWMPFIMEITPINRFEFARKYPLVVDPSLKIAPLEVFYCFNESELMLHHFSMLRDSIENKFNNAAASIRWKPEQIKTYLSEYRSARVGDSISYFGGRKLIEVENIFGI